MRSLARRHAFLLSALGLFLAAVGLLVWSWGTWADVLVDFGRELYVPWQITDGRVLYRDLAHLHGPLSQYLNAGLFALFGSSLTTLVVANFLWLFGLVLLLLWLGRRAGSLFAGVVLALLFLTVFAFSQYVGTANYNFVCPYTHELTHGLILAVAALALLVRRPEDGGALRLGAVGLLAGLVFLTKPEVFLALGLALVVTLPLALSLAPRRTRLVGLGVFAGGALLPPLVAGGLLAAALGVGEAFGQLFFGYAQLGDPTLSALPFYQQMSGLADPVGNLGLALRGAGLSAGLLVWAGALAYVVGRRAAGQRGLAWLVVLAHALAFLLLRREIPWALVARGLPLVVGALLVLGLVVGWRRPTAEGRRAWLPLLALAALALGLLAKILLNARIFHYGFALALPATLAFVWAALQHLPAWIARRGGSLVVARGVVLAAVTAFAFFHLEVANAVFSVKTSTVSNGAWELRSDERGPFVQAAYEQLQARMAAGDTLAVLPEGVMLNVLLRAPNPTPYVNLMPHEIAMFGPEKVRESFVEAAPRFLALVHKDTAEYGPPVLRAGLRPRARHLARARLRPLRAARRGAFYGRGFRDRVAGAAVARRAEAGDPD